MSITLYVHPASITSRPVRLFVAEKRLVVMERVIDIVTGEHYKDEYTSINPNRLVPALEDGAFRLTESSAILKYLATRFEAPEYPLELELRAKVDEAMDWFSTQLYRDFVYDFIYPQILRITGGRPRSTSGARSAGAGSGRCSGSTCSTGTSSAATTSWPTTGPRSPTTTVAASSPQAT